MILVQEISKSKGKWSKDNGREYLENTDKRKENGNTEDEEGLEN